MYIEQQKPIIRDIDSTNSLFIAVEDDDDSWISYLEIIVFTLKSNQFNVWKFALQREDRNAADCK